MINQIYILQVYNTHIYIYIIFYDIYIRLVYI